MVLSNEQSIEKLTEGVDLICNIVKATFGPRGKNIILFDGADKPFMTKDGISVAKHVYSEDPAVQAAVEIVRQASEQTAEKGGDGTTSSLILAQAFFKYGLQCLKDKTYTMLDLKKEFAEVKEIINKELERLALPVEFSQESLANIATISTNNDTNLGNLVANAYMLAGKEGVVKAELTESFITKTELQKGATYKLGVADKYFFNSATKAECNYENCLVFLYNNQVKDIDNIRPAIIKAAQSKTPIVIFAHDFSELALTQFYTNKAKGLLEVVPIKLFGFEGHKKDLLADLSALTGGEIYDNNKLGNFEPILGFCNKITSNLIDTCIFVENTTEAFEQHIEKLTKIMENEDVPALKALYQDRINSLRGNIATIFVGGITAVETKEKFDRIEDAICAVKASLEEGIVAGGGSTLAQISNVLDAKYALTKTCLWAPFKQLCINSDLEFTELQKYALDHGYDFYYEEPADLLDNGIVDPKKVIRLSVENAISVALALLTTEGIVR